MLNTKSENTPGIVHIKDVDILERIIFPQKNDVCIVSMSFGENHIVLDGLAFSSKSLMINIGKMLSFIEIVQGIFPLRLLAKELF